MRKLTPEREAEAAEYVRAHWCYNPLTGFITGRGGKVIGTLRKDGALQALVYLPSRTTSVLLHRAAWLLSTGAWPEHEIDHEDGDRTNNRRKNLRSALKGENRQNLKAVGKRGVLIGCTPYYRKWKAQIRLKGKVHYLGLFNTEQEAHAAYCEAKTRLHTFNPKQRPPTA
jgi:hypothetical protein